MAKAVKNTQDKSGKKGGGKADSKSRKSPSKAGASAASSGAPGKAAPREKRGVAKFIRDVRVEMGKVTWPSRQDLVQSTIVVLVAVAIAAAYVGVLDLAFSEFVRSRPASPYLRSPCTTGTSSTLTPATRTR